jgi:hypothetical protein
MAVGEASIGAVPRTDSSLAAHTIKFLYCPPYPLLAERMYLTKYII